MEYGETVVVTVVANVKLFNGQTFISAAIDLAFLHLIAARAE